MPLRATVFFFLLSTYGAHLNWQLEKHGRAHIDTHTHNTSTFGVACRIWISADELNQKKASKHGGLCCLLSLVTLQAKGKETLRVFVEFPFKEELANETDKKW